ncbi:MAG: hypothetical protein E7175_02595 [Erysipelotrichaceae bacterium]|nr:hypothetical protein [Erysipelotrichaceae bacterium]
MNIMMVNDIDSKFEELIRKCKECGEPVYINNDGKIELVAVDINYFKEKEQELEIQQLVLESYISRLNGGKNYSIAESRELLLSSLKN